ncbi:MAG: hypothetical protein Q8P41_05550 [Pseudomonadota bacterium]|nr:hypothetical protein [Pseudomonadota bacterium]
MLIPAAFGHGASFGATAVSVSRDDPREVWVLTDGWGLAHTTDGGDAWEWLCEESLGGQDLYGVLATGPGAAVVATRTGLRTVGADCGAALQPGPPADTFFPVVTAYGAGWLGLGIAEEAGGVWACDLDGCAATDLMAPGLFPKSALADGARAWVTVVYVDSLASELWRSDDGVSWTRVHEWPDGDTDPRILRADGDRLLVWRRTRSEADTPELLVSDDGGATFASTLATGWYTDSTPGLLALDGALLLGSAQGARTWRSEDDGGTWAEVSGDVPAVRCGDTVGGVGYACGDHLQDGFDLSQTTDGHTWLPIACLEEALPADCATGTCDPLLSAWQLAGSYGGGECDTIITPPEGVEDAPACGCGAGTADSAAALGVLVGLARLRRRARAHGARKT